MAGVADVVTEMHVNDNGQSLRLVDGAKERFLLPQELLLLAERSAVFEVAGWYGDFDLGQPLDMSPRSRRMIVALRKMATADG